MSRSRAGLAYRYLVWNLVLAMRSLRDRGPRRPPARALRGGAGDGPSSRCPSPSFGSSSTRTPPTSSPTSSTSSTRPISGCPPPIGSGLSALLWYDLLMNAVFAFIGHFIGLVSMWLVQRGFAEAWGPKASRVLVARGHPPLRLRHLPRPLLAPQFLGRRLRHEEGLGRGGRGDRRPQGHTLLCRLLALHLPDLRRPR